MKKELRVPAMGESVSEVSIGQILAPTGTIVKVDAEIVELETDKVNQVLYAPQAGKVQLTVRSGDTVKIGEIIGTIEEGEGEDQIPTSSPLETSSPSLTPKISFPQIPSSDESLRYTKSDFLKEKTSPSPVLQEERANAQPKKKGEKRETRRPLSKIRKVITERLVEAQRKSAMLTTFNEVDMTEVIHLREKYKEAFVKKYGTKLGFMSFFVKAAVSALQAYPIVNSYLDGEEIVQREYFDIGVAVGTEKGVIVPVIKNSEQLSFAEIEQAIEKYAMKAREGALTLEDLQGGGFTITNGGIYGSLLSTPILVPSQCGILGMHKIEKRPVVIEDKIEIRSMMYLALSYDHRLVDGKDAVSFLVHIKNVIEDPSRLFLGV